MCNFCLSFPACVEWAVLQTGSLAGEQQSSGLVGSCFLLCLLHIRLEESWAAKTQVLVLSFSPLQLFQYWPYLLSFFCVSHCGWLETNTASLPSAKPDAPQQDFWCCLFQVELETPARDTKAALRANVCFCNTWSSEKLGWYSGEKQ